MKILAYLWSVFLFGLFIFTLPSAVESTHYWISFLSRAHAWILSLAMAMAGFMPDAPAGLAEASFGRAAMAPFVFWPHVVFLLLLCAASIALGHWASRYLTSYLREKNFLPIWRRSFFIIWLVYAFFGPKLTLHAAYPGMGEFRPFEPIFQTIGRTADPTTAIYLSQIYVVVALVFVFLLTIVVPVSWVKHKSSRRSRHN